MSALPAGYMEFLEGKRASAPSSGFDPGDGVSDVLFGFQRDIVRWAVSGGRRAIFAAFGFGKSLMQLEALRLILAHDGGRGVELNAGYWLDGVKYLQAQERRSAMPMIFDLIGDGE